MSLSVHVLPPSAQLKWVDTVDAEQVAALAASGNKALVDDGLDARVDVGAAAAAALESDEAKKVPLRHIIHVVTLSPQVTAAHEAPKEQTEEADEPVEGEDGGTGGSEPPAAASRADEADDHHVDGAPADSADA